MLLTVIIPCYRETKMQLTRCLKSLTFLTGICQWEAWIVDDGSPENQIEKWVRDMNDNHLHFIRQHNQGQSVARNTAIEQARGEYIALLDADDEWIPAEYARIIEILQKERPDMLGLRYQATRVPYYDGSSMDFIQKEDIIPAACGYIYKRDKLGDLRYTPGIYHEDEEFNTLLHLKMNRLIMTPIVAYRYHRNPDSTTQSQDEKHLEKRFSDFHDVICRIQKMSVTDSRLERRLHVMAMCYVVDLMRSAPSSAFLRRHLLTLKESGLYPLPAFRGIRRYTWIRPLTSQPWLCCLHRKFLRLFGVR